MEYKLICPNNPDHKTFEGNAKVDQLWLTDEHGEYTSTLQECEQVVAKPDRDHYACHECGVGAIWVPAVSEMRRIFVADDNGGMFTDADGLTKHYVEPTIQGFWACECEDDYVHRTDLQPFCYRCKTSCEDQSDATLHQILINLQLSPEELAAICKAVVRLYTPGVLA